MMGSNSGIFSFLALLVIKSIRKLISAKFPDFPEVQKNFPDFAEQKGCSGTFLSVVLSNNQSARLK